MSKQEILGLTRLFPALSSTIDYYKPASVIIPESVFIDEIGGVRFYTEALVRGSSKSRYETRYAQGGTELVDYSGGIGFIGIIRDGSRVPRKKRDATGKCIDEIIVFCGRHINSAKTQKSQSNDELPLHTFTKICMNTNQQAAHTRPINTGELVLCRNRILAARCLLMPGRNRIPADGAFTKEGKILIFSKPQTRT